MRLSRREQEAVILLADDYTVKETAVRMGISARTVWCYICRAKEKLGVTTLPGLILAAVVTGEIAVIFDDMTEQ